MRLINADECINEIKRRERIVEVRRTEAIDPNLDHEIFTEREYWNGIFCTFEETIDVIDNMNSWISVKDKLPKQKKSMFAKFYGTDRWSRAMWRFESERVIVAVKFKDGTRTVTTGRIRDGEWKTDISPTLEPEVTHWMPFPQKPKEEQDEAN